MLKATSVLCVLSIAAVPARGQVTNTIGIQPGSTVRFQIGGDASYRSGVLSRFTADSLIVERCPTCQGRLLYARSELTRLDVSERMPSGSRVLTGFGVGGLTGLALGALGAAACGGGYKCEDEILLVPFGGLFGGLVGALIGYLTAYKWVPVPLAR